MKSKDRHSESGMRTILKYKRVLIQLTFMIFAILITIFAEGIMKLLGQPEEIARDITSGAIGVIFATLISIADYLFLKPGEEIADDNNFALMVDSISKLHEKIEESPYSRHLIANYSFGDAFSFVFSKKTHIDHLIIYAISTTIIHPLVNAANGITINKCTLLLKEHSGDEREKFSDFEAEICNLIIRWKNMKKVGKIKNLTIIRYTHQPTEYNCIFDNDYVITGLYSAREDAPGVRAHSPLVFSSDTYEGRSAITKYAERAFELIEHYKKLYIKRLIGNGDTVKEISTATGLEHSEIEKINRCV